MLGPVVFSIPKEPKSIKVNDITYFYELHRFCGPLPCRRNGDERKTPFPLYVWDAIEAAEGRADE